MTEEKKEKPQSFYDPEYICFNCGYVVKWSELQAKIICPRCGGKIFFKKRPEDRTKKIKAR